MLSSRETDASRASVETPKEAPMPWPRIVSRPWTITFAVMLAAAVGLRILAMGLVPLIPEEAYYWMYAQHPSLSYYDHPPMVAWVIWLGTAIFGNNEFGVRVVGHLLMIGASLLLYQFGRMWFGRTAGLLSAVMLHVLPLYFGVGLTTTMDSALLFFWAMCLVGVSQALRREQAWGWYLAGFALGAAILSKYTGIFLATGTVLVVVAHPPYRRHLLTVHPYLAVLLAAAIFSPVVIWNANHHWASFRFQFVDRFAGKTPIRVHFILTFIIYQVIALTPLALWGCITLFARVARSRRRLFTPRWLIAICFSLPLLLVMAYSSLRHEIHINWTLPLFLSLFPALSHQFIARLRALRTPIKRQRWARGFAWTAMGCVALNAGFVLYLLTLQPRLQWIPAFGPWRELAGIVQQYEERLEHESGREPLIVGLGKCRLASVLAFYRMPLEKSADASQYTTSQWVLGGSGLGYEYWSDRNHWRGQNCIYVVDDADHQILPETEPLFDSVTLVNDPRLTALGRRDYRIAICRGLRNN